MPTQQTVGKNIVVNFTASELNTALISAAETYLGRSIDDATVYVVDADGTPMVTAPSPQSVIRSARVIALDAAEG